MKKYHILTPQIRRALKAEGWPEPAIRYADSYLMACEFIRIIYTQNHYLVNMLERAGSAFEAVIKAAETQEPNG